MTLASRQPTYVRKISSATAVFLVAILTPVTASPQGAATSGAKAPNAAVIGGCVPVRVKFSASLMADGEVTTTSTAFVNIPQAILNVQQGGLEPSCIIVQFSAVAFAPGSNRMGVRALLNNVTPAQPGEMIFATNDNAASQFSQARAANFIFPNAAPGTTHTIQMQFRSLNGGGVRIGRHTTIVNYVPLNP